MKTLVHTQRDTSICIYEIEAEKIIGSFFKQKPKVGDILMFEVKQILENRDANMNSDCNYDPSGAYFKLSVRNVTTDPRFSNIDKSISINLK